MGVVLDDYISQRKVMFLAVWEVDRGDPFAFEVILPNGNKESPVSVMGESVLKCISGVSDNVILCLVKHALRFVERAPLSCLYDVR